MFRKWLLTAMACAFLAGGLIGCAEQEESPKPPRPPKGTAAKPEQKAEAKPAAVPEAKPAATTEKEK